MSNSPARLEIWGGVECTINRVGEIFFDQCEWSRHRERVRDDLQLFAALGLRTLRTSVLWEHFERTQSWQSADEQLNCMREQGLHPIAGLLHHGSGPRSTDLLDPHFPEKFAAYAAQVAARFPWITDYTPINEPQTTARFSCLYGHWFPHHRSMHSCVRALFHEMKGIVLAMEAIRCIQPDARLIHTEDGGATYSPPALESFRMHREHRRWLGLDLLCGRVTQHHALFGFLLEHGLSEHEILWFAERPCPPAIVGLNYYVTSDRFLDDRLHLYPEHFAGGDTGFEPLVDIEAVRVHPDGIAGSRRILEEAWQRYGLPVAITEAHLGCQPLEQVRWLAEIWRGAEAARAGGADVRAVTAWGLLGLYNWSHLCTRDPREYEAGIFDLSRGAPQATPLAGLVQQLAEGKPPQHAALRASGWWRRDTRLTIPSPVPPAPELGELVMAQ